MNSHDTPSLSPTGLTPTQKFWVSPGGDIVPLMGLWHYQWALGNRDVHGVDLAGETDEQPVRLKMLAGGWWRMNYERKTCALTVEGDVAGIGAGVRGAVVEFVRSNAVALNRVRVNVLDGEAVAASHLIAVAGKLGDEVGEQVRETLTP